MERNERIDMFPSIFQSWLYFLEERIKRELAERQTIINDFKTKYEYNGGVFRNGDNEVSEEFIKFASSEALDNLRTKF